MTRKLSFLTTLCGGLASVFVTGCLGPELLAERTEHTPAPNPDVELRLKTSPPADVLIVYNEHEHDSGKVIRRAFFLFANESRLTTGKRPVFVRAGTADGHARIPILTQRPSESEPLDEDLYALSTSPTSFELWSRDRTLAEFQLPAYGNWMTAKKFFLFPLAVAADAVGVGAAVGAAAAVGVVEGAAESGTSFTFP